MFANSLMVNTTRKYTRFIRDIATERPSNAANKVGGLADTPDDIGNVINKATPKTSTSTSSANKRSKFTSNSTKRHKRHNTPCSWREREKYERRSLYFMTGENKCSSQSNTNTEVGVILYPTSKIFPGIRCGVAVSKTVHRLRAVSAATHCREYTRRAR